MELHRGVDLEVAGDKGHAHIRQTLRFENEGAGSGAGTGPGQGQGQDGVIGWGQGGWLWVNGSETWTCGEVIAEEQRCRQCPRAMSSMRSTS